MEKLRILVVDDMNTARTFIKYGLERNHGNVVIDEAANGREAKMKLESQRYDLVLCDWEMPMMSGEELLLWVRGHDALKDLRFIMITAKSDRESVMSAMKSGVNGYLVKPFTIEGLLQKMTDIDRRFDRRQFERFTITGSVAMRFGSDSADGELLDISIGGLLASFPRESKLPAILEKAAVDMKTNNGVQVQGIESFVVRIQAADAFLDTRQIRIAVKFLEIDSARMKQLKEFVDNMKKA